MYQNGKQKTIFVKVRLNLCTIAYYERYCCIHFFFFWRLTLTVIFSFVSIVIDTFFLCNLNSEFFFNLGLNSSYAITKNNFKKYLLGPVSLLIHLRNRRRPCTTVVVVSDLFGVLFLSSLLCKSYNVYPYMFLHVLYTVMAE